jgi:hypothetical protein
MAASVNTSVMALYASEADAHVRHLQERLMDAERKIYDLTVDRDALRRQVDSLTHQVYSLRCREGPSLQSAGSLSQSLGKRVAVIDAISDEVTEELVA